MNLVDLQVTTIPRLLARLSRDTNGAVSAISLILITTIVGIGAAVGLVIVHDHVTQEFGDIAVSLDHLDQTFSYRIEINGNIVTTASYPPLGQGPDVAVLQDLNGQPPTCLSLSDPPVQEGNLIQEPVGSIP